MMASRTRPGKTSAGGQNFQEFLLRWSLPGCAWTREIRSQSKKSGPTKSFGFRFPPRICDAPHVRMSRCIRTILLPHKSEEHIPLKLKSGIWISHQVCTRIGYMHNVLFQRNEDLAHCPGSGNDEPHSKLCGNPM